MTTIAKNNSGQAQEFLSIILLDGAQRTISDSFSPFEIAQDEELQALIASGDIVINDGTQDLSIADAQNITAAGNPSLVPLAEAQGGTAETIRYWSSERVRQALEVITDPLDTRIDSLENLGGEELPQLLVRTTSDFGINTTPSFLPFASVDIETAPDIIELDPLDNTKIIFKEAGDYFVALNLVHDASGGTLVTTEYYYNGLAPIAGSEYTTNPTNNGSAVTPAGIFVAQNANDFVQIRCYTNQNTGDINENSTVAIFRLKGLKGEKGDTGSGSNVTVEDNDASPVVADIINFGSNLTVTDDGGGQVTVDASGGTAPVDSVNGQTGIVVLDADDIDDAATAHKFVSQTFIDNTNNHIADDDIHFRHSTFQRWSSSNQGVNGNTYINFQNGDANNTDVTQVSSSTYQLNTIGEYKVSFKGNIRKQGGAFQGNRRFDGAIQLDTGGGFSDQNVSYFQQLQYNEGSDEGMVTIWAIIRVTVANTWDVRVRVNGNGSNTTCDSLGTSLLIEYLGDI